MKLLKILIALIIIAVLVLVIAGVLLVAVVDPNYFKGQISHAVESKTGRQLVIKGNIERSVFPWIGVRVHDLELGNAPGFADRGQFLTVGEADIRVQLLPLFSKRVEVEKLTLKDVNLNLIKNSAGQTNWADLNNTGLSKSGTTTTTTTTTTSTAMPTPAAAPFAVMIAGIDIRNADLNYSDEQKAQTVQIKDLNISSKGLGAGQTFPLSLDFALASNKPQIAGNFSLDANVTANARQNLYQLDKIRFNSTLSGWKAPLQLMADQLNLDLNQQNFAVNNLVLSSGDLNLKGRVQGQNILKDPLIQGHLEAGAFNLKALLQSLGKNFATQDGNALQRVSGVVDFQAGPQAINVNPLNLVVDDSTVQGNLSVQNFGSMALRFNLAVNQINLDRYLPPSAEKTAQQPATAATLPTAATAAASVRRPSFLQKANINGDLRVGSLTLAKTVFSNVYALVRAQGGQIQISPFNADVFQGSSKGQVSIDLRSATPTFTIAENLQKIQLNQLTKSNRLTGTANITANLSMRGNGKAELLRSLNGNTKFAVENGVLMGVNIPSQIERIMALIKKQPVPAATGGNQTEFGEFTGTGVFTNGVFNNSDLLIQSSQFKITGYGTANLITEALNYRLQAVGLHAVDNGQGGTQVEQRQTPIPLLVTGTFSKPVIVPDPEAIARLLLQQKVENIKERIQQRTGETVAPIRERARDFLLNRLGQ